MPDAARRVNAGRAVLAVLLGGVGGPLSCRAAVRMGAVAVGPHSLLTFGVLALEYALVTPLTLLFAPQSEARQDRREPSIS